MLTNGKKDGILPDVNICLLESSLKSQAYLKGGGSMKHEMLGNTVVQPELTPEEGRMDHRGISRLLLACGAIGSPLFVLVLLIEGATRPGYSWWYHPGSLLSLGEQGWMQTTNFMVWGLLLLCFAIGQRLVLWSGKRLVWGPLLVALSGVGFVLSGMFVPDPSFGYPPGVQPHSTLHGLIHNLAGMVVFSCLTVTCFVLAGRFAGDPRWKGWRPYSIITGTVAAVFFLATGVASSLDVNGALPHAPIGLFQRLALISDLGWIMLFALRLLREREPVASGEVAPAARPR